MLPAQTLPTPIAPPLLLVPPADLFKRRANRLRQLAHGHSLGPWLSWLADMSDAQQVVLDQLPAPPDNTWPESTVLSGAVPAAYGKLLTALPALPGGRAVGAVPSDDLARSIESNLQLATGEIIAAGRDINDLLVAAAMQAVWSAAARHAAPPGSGLTHGETCPHCGSVALGSIVLAGEGKGGLRYQECCLCATRWNAVRARCTLCTDGAVVNYLSLEGENGAVSAETCDNCHGYAKIFFEAKDGQLDPTADDLATLALDVLVGEHGYARGAPNLLLCEGEAA